MSRANVALPSPVPIIDSVEVAVLSLFEVEVNISLLTNGGQSVTQYTVSIGSLVFMEGVCLEMSVRIRSSEGLINFDQVLALKGQNNSVQLT